MRFFIAFPTLLVHAIIYAIFLNRHNLNNPDPAYVQFVQYLFREVCLYLGLASSVLGLLHLIGWVSTFYNMTMFILNSVFNYMVFCDEKYDNSFFTSLVAFVLNIVGLIITYSLSHFLLDTQMISTAYFTAWAASILIMLFIKIKSYCSNNSDISNKYPSTRFYAMLIIESVTVIFVFLIYFFVFQPLRHSYDQIKIIAIIILSINIAFYALFLFFKELRAARSIFGCVGCINLSPTSTSTIDLIHRYILRTMSTLSVLAILSSIPLYRVA